MSIKKDELKKLRERPVEDIQKEILDSRDKLRVLRFDLASGKTKNSSLVRAMRKRISVLETLISEKTQKAVKDQSKADEPLAQAPAAK